MEVGGNCLNEIWMDYNPTVIFWFVSFDGPSIINGHPGFGFIAKIRNSVLIL